MIELRRLLVIFLVTQLASLLLGAGSAAAGTSLYYGSIRIILSTGASSAYSIPFGSIIGYPQMNNLPTGDLATVNGSAPAAIGLGSNQMTLETSLPATVPPSSWGVPEVFTSFSGGHLAGSFFELGAPGAASSGPLGGLPVGQFGVEFKGTPSRFGGTMALLGKHRKRWGTAWSYGLIICTACSVWNDPLSAIGGSFGGAVSQTTWINGTGLPPTFFDVTIWGFPWSTGTVTARAPSSMGAVNSLIYKGTDQRTAGGAGNIQLVTPFVLRRTRAPGTPTQEVSYQAGIAIANLQFLPEPSALLLLASGLATLGCLSALSKRTNQG